MTRPGIIIQARMGSTRFPKKVMHDFCGKPILRHVVQRCKASGLLVVVATTVLSEDDPIAGYCDVFGTNYYRGASENVLDRFICAARAHGVDPIIRVCADCPLIDPSMISRLLAEWDGESGYCSYRIIGCPAVRTHAGLPELVTFTSLCRLRQYVGSVTEHVTYGCYSSQPIDCQWVDLSGYENEHNTIDTPEDLERLERLCHVPT